METRNFGKSGEQLPVVGLGTWLTFDVGPDEDNFAAPVVEAMYGGGSRVVDSSPMYGRAEGVLGRAISGIRDQLFVATKIWTEGLSGEDAVLLGRFQYEAQLAFYGGRVELEQIHNLEAWQDHLPWLEAEKEKGRIGYIGATHWQPEAFPTLIEIMKTGRLDAVQVPYNPLEREAEKEVLPLAQELDIPVFVMRPFGQGDLMPGPEPSKFAELGVASWGEALIKWALSHPAIRVVIPATSKPEHGRANAAAGDRPWFDGKQREMVQELAKKESERAAR